MTTPPPRQCAKCGTVLRGAALFCATCGAPREAKRAPLPIGHVMHNGEYRILSTLGKGGMGVVYLAENQAAFNRRCVIKQMVVYYDLTEPEQVLRAQKRFESEARTLAQLHHSSIPDIQKYFSEDGRSYIVMEYVEGKSLLDAVTHEDDHGHPVPAHRLAPSEIIQYGIQLCDILMYLADFTPPVIHHDVKPANVIIDSSEGRARLVDFGTATIHLGAQPQSPSQGAQSSLYGTAGYAPPEQFKGKSGPYSDVYALAATLYHLLTDDHPGSHPFDFPLLSTLPYELGSVLARALALDVDHRISAVELRQGLLRAQQSAQISSNKGVRVNPLEATSAVHSTSDLWQWCDAHWSHALVALASGRLEQCLLELGEAEFAQRAAQCQILPNPSIGLETLLRAIGAPPPRQWESNQLDIVGQLGYGLFPRLGNKPNSIQFRILNKSVRGCLHGHLKPTANWLRIPRPSFQCMPGEVTEIEIQLDYQHRSRRWFWWREPLFDIVIE